MVLLLARYKARLVARGVSQQADIDYNETYSPVIKTTSFRLLLALATLHDYHIHQMDVTTAFLHGVLKEVIYVSQPEGFIQPGNKHKVCQLLKSLYGLKQSACVWYEVLDSFLVAQGFFCCKFDTNVYIKCYKTLFILLGLYIDDLILISNDLKFLFAIKVMLSQHFSMIDNNDIEYILGVQIRRDEAKRTLILSRDKYILDILPIFNMQKNTSVSTPLEVDICYIREESETLSLDEQHLMSSIPY